MKKTSFGRVGAEQGGFTLIELVMVIVILGILSAIALPKFIDLSSQAGLASAQGVAGAAGSPGVSGYEVVTSGLFVNAPNNQDFGSVFCPAGKHALGGGVASNATLQTE